MCRAAGLGREDIAAGMRSFKGLAHRQQHVGAVNGVLYVNDSKATNAEAAARALSSYRDIYWIAGGRAKDGGLGPVLGALANVRHVFLIGEAAVMFAQELKGRVPAVTISGDLKTAVAEARAQCAADSAEQAMAEPVVLLAPACASFDQFSDFEARGDAFRALAAADGEAGPERAS
ncbi:MAG: glutamate ligase domain-containing protein [Rhodospirillales bacterium]